MGTDRFSRHVPQSHQVANRCTLTPDANFSRNVSFHVITAPDGDDRWTGRYLHDLIEVVAEHYPEGLLVEIEGITYLLSVAPAPKGPPNG